MKILHTVESYDPASHGMQQVVKQLSERLSRSGHHVTVATRFDPNRQNLTINGVNIEEFKISGRAVDGYNAEETEIQRYRDFLLNSDFDVITNFAAQQWATDIALPLLKQIKAVKVFVPTGFSELNNIKFKDYFDLMKFWLKDYDMNVFLSNDYQDVNFAKENEVKNIKIIPNGASAEEFLPDISIDIRKQLNVPHNHFLILHVGSHTGLKGHKEAIEIFKKAKIKNATLLIIGNSTHHGSKINYWAKFLFKSFANLFYRFSGKKYFPACSISCSIKGKTDKFSFDRIFNKKFLLVKNLSRKETVAAYMEADLFLFPSNIECSPLVLFECMASRTPFLTSDVGNTKEIISWSNSGSLLASEKIGGYSMTNVKESALILENLLLDRAKIENMKEVGFEVFSNNYSWDKISKEYENLYQGLKDKHIILG